MHVDGGICATYYDFVYFFIGDKENTLTYNGNIVSEHPKFANINKFEGWVRRFYAEGKTIKTTL